MLVAAPVSARSQDPAPAPAPQADGLPVATAGFPGDRFIAGDSPITFTLSRPLAAGEGRLALVVAATDVTALADRTPTAITYRPRALRLPSGEGEAVLYVVKDGGWTELARAPLRVLATGGFTAASAKPSAALSMKGQLAEGHSADVPAPERPTYQDLAFSSGLQSTHARGGWTLRTQSNFLGVSRREEALRFGAEQDGAPRFDLSDYVVQLDRGPANIALGNVTAGSNQYLVSGFASRGVTATVRGAAASFAAAAMNGSSVVGWDNFTGLGHGDHRIYSATLGLEMRPKRPGALHVDATLLDGSLLPQTAFTQGALVDAERSTGGGVQLAASTPSQRLRVAAGLSRSRFDTPGRDPQLQGDTALVPVRRETRAARYVELNAVLLQNAKLPKLFSTTLNAGYRHERVDPLYRSVAAYTQADRLQHAFDLSGSLGAMSMQLSHSRGEDNLDDLPSVLKTRTHMSAATVSAPVAALLGVRRHATRWPQLAYAVSQNHQFGAGVPVNSDFSATHVPDQVSTVHDASAAWQLAKWRLQYRFNRSEQDNRQVGRERSDLIGTANTVSLGFAVWANLDLSVDASAERQSNRELGQVARVRRVGGTVNWRATPLTTLTAFASASTSFDEPATSDADNGELRVELARGFDLWRAPGGGGTRGQLFLRYASQSASMRQLVVVTADAPLLRAARDTWTLSSGVSLRLF